MKDFENRFLSQMCIFHFCSALDLAKGGRANGLVSLVTQLSQFGIQNDIFSSGITREQIARNSICFAELLNLGVNIRFSISHVENEYGLGNFMDFRAGLKHDLVPDLIVLHQVYTLSTLIGFWYAKKINVPYVVFPHGSLTLYIESHSKLIKSIANRLVVSRILREANAVIVTCESEKKDLIKSLQSKAVLLTYGAEIKTNLPNSIESLSDKESIKRILFCGRFDKVKNIPLLLAAMPLIINRYPNTILDLAGSGSKKEFDELKKITADLKIENNVVFHGWVNKIRLEELFKVTNLLVLPSKSENFALVVSEALSSGIPCVVSKFVGVSDIVARHKAGVIIEELTVESVAASVIKVLDGDHQAYRNAALRAVDEDLNWSKIALKWKAMIRSLALD